MKKHGKRTERLCIKRELDVKQVFVSNRVAASGAEAHGDDTYHPTRMNLQLAGVFIPLSGIHCGLSIKDKTLWDRREAML